MCGDGQPLLVHNFVRHFTTVHGDSFPNKDDLKGWVLNWDKSAIRRQSPEECYLKKRAEEFQEGGLDDLGVSEIESEIEARGEPGLAPASNDKQTQTVLDGPTMLVLLASYGKGDSSTGLGTDFG